MSEWFEWNGGDMPVWRGTKIEVRWRNGTTWPAFAGEGAAEDWEHYLSSDDIIAYRVIEDQSALSKQEGGSHYKDFPIQPVEFIHRNGIGFCEGNAIKYLCRWREKNGVEDLRKAIHYIEMLIEFDGKAK